MSIGNLNDSGNKSTNMPWQWKMLLGQQGAIDLLTAISDSTDNIEPYLVDLINNTNAVLRTPNLLRATGAGTINVATYSFSVSNIGSANGSILGSTIKIGETLNFDAGALCNYFAANSITYDGTGTELLIIYIV